MRLQLTDVTIILFSVSGTAILQFLLGERGSTPALRYGLLLACLWMVMLAAFGTRGAAVVGSGATEYRRVAHATGFAFGLATIAGVLLNWSGLRPQLLISLPLGLLGLLFARWLWRRWLIGQRRQSRYASRTLVVGGKDDVEYVIRSLQEPGTGYQVVGATLTDSNAQSISVEDMSYAVEGSYATVPQAAARLEADSIIVASRPDGDPDFVKQLAWDLEGTAAELVLSSRLTDVAGPRISLRQVDGLPLIQVKIPTYEGTAHVLKRALDVVVATLALIPIALITPLLALLIKLDSPGPVFFRQERVGRDGELFPILKFRTMQTDAEQRLGELQALNEGSGPLFKLRQDPRVTRVGAVLRKFSLDELPQFWNVLRGEMSVVGPRPPLPSEVVDYDGRVSRRLYINPGITGPWQVSGRSDLSWDESVRLDLGYVENWSVMSDLMIMWRTAKVMLQPSGAY